MKVDKQTAKEWRQNIEYQILRLNSFIGNQLTGENFHELQFRGRNHRPVLFKDGMLVASGMFSINSYIYSLLKYYHII